MPRTVLIHSLLILVSCQNPAMTAEDQPDSEVVVSRIATAGCHKQFEPATALARYVEAKPDLMLWVGDNVYADTTDDIGYLRKCYDALAAKPAFRQLREQTTLMATWDDHDFGLNNSGENYPLKKQSKTLFREFWKLEDRVPADREGVYYSRMFGSGNRALQVIMLDTRYNREDEGPESDTLGESQWRWLADELAKPAALRLLVSGYQVLLEKGTPWETWAKFPKARKRLFDLIKMQKAAGILFITGDQHSGEVLRVRDALGYDGIEFMFAGINQEEQHVKSAYRVSPASHAKHAYALIDIHWEDDHQKPDKNEGGDQPHLVFRVFDAWTNAPELTYRVNFSELRSR